MNNYTFYGLLGKTMVNVTVNEVCKPNQIGFVLVCKIFSLYFMCFTF